MGIKKQVFASAAERANFQKLHSRWGDRYNLYHNLPFLNVLDLSNLIDVAGWPRRIVPLTISDIEHARLKKTSIDYVLCNSGDAPLVCVEYDGMQDGFNVGTSYKTAAEQPSSWRDDIISLKLRVAHGSLLPYFVVGVREFRDISLSVKLCIVDTLIGEVLANQALSQRTSVFKPEDIGMTDEEFDQLPPFGQEELIQNWLIGVEVEADFTFNPVFEAVHDLHQELCKQLGSVSFTWNFAPPPTTGDNMSPTNHARALGKASRHGATCTVKTNQYGEITRTIWLPNFQVPGYSDDGFLPELAQLVALDAVRRLASKQG